MNRVSIIIPSYNSGAKLGQTLDHLLASDVSSLAEVELIVVDDGSPSPVEPVVASRAAASNRIALRCIRQQNAGPAAARNTGFREAQGELIIFIDDDILVPPDLIRKHVEAHHTHPGSVICGRCPYVTPRPISPVFRYINSLGYDAGENSIGEFTGINIIASGQISFERKMFDAGNGIYCDDLATPSAEEYELSLRLRERAIPILLANEIVALHNHEVLIETICQQGFKYGIGCGEAAVKRPQTLDLKELDNIIAVNRPSSRSDSIGLILKKGIKRPLATRWPRACLLKIIRLAEKIMPQYSLLRPLYGVSHGLHFFAGVRTGLRRYSGNE